MKEFKFFKGHQKYRYPTNGERRVFTINVGDLSSVDIEHYMRQLTTSMAIPIPIQYIDHPTLISSRGLNNE